jgi:RNA polymerase sigma-70 factor (ECF subfamily)
MTTRDLADRLRSLLEEYGHVLRRAIRRVAGRGFDVDDVEQEAVLRVWRAMQQEKVFERPASYLYRVAVHATLDAVQKRNARREEPIEAVGPEPAAGSTSPEGIAARREKISRVRESMKRLPPNRRRALGLHLQGFTPGEIADFYGWTEAKARNLAYRGLHDLRRLLEDEEGDPP